jgi:hypothetical protein
MKITIKSLLLTGLALTPALAMPPRKMTRIQQILGEARTAGVAGLALPPVSARVARVAPAPRPKAGSLTVPAPLTGWGAAAGPSRRALAAASFTVEPLRYTNASGKILTLSLAQDPSLPTRMAQVQYAGPGPNGDGSYALGGGRPLVMLEGQSIIIRMAAGTGPAQFLVQDLHDETLATLTHTFTPVETKAAGETQVTVEDLEA